MDKVCSFPHTTVSQVTRVRNLANTDVWHSKWRKIIPALCQSQKHSRSLLADRPSFWLIAFSLLRSLTWEPALWKSHLTWIRVNKFSPDSICFSSIYYYEFLLLLFLYEFSDSHWDYLFLSFALLMWISIISISTVLRLAVTKRLLSPKILSLSQGAKPSRHLSPTPS